jgi:hypothetical protein
MEPKPPSSRLAQQQAETLDQQQQAKQATAKEFATAEELIRHDAARTSPPPTLEDRVKQSIATEPPPEPKAWWKRLLGR